MEERGGEGTKKGKSKEDKRKEDKKGIQGKGEIEQIRQEKKQS